MITTSQGDRRPRTLFFYTHALTGGGAERVWAQLASGFARTGDAVAMIVDSEAPENLRHLDPRVKLIVLGDEHPKAVLRLAREIAAARPDAILAALSISNLKGTIAATLAGARRRVILSYHGFADAEPQRLSRLSYRATALLTRMTGATVAVSDALRRDLIDSWRGDPTRIVRIYNPVDISVDAPSRGDRPTAARPNILAVGRLVAVKKIASLLHAFAALDRPDAVLTIVGDGPERPALLALAERLGIGARVRLPGWQDDLSPFYSDADCYALSSSSEAFGLTVVEALAQGLPVVTTDCSGPREILADGRFGELVPIGDIPALTRALARALVDPGDRAARIARARDFSLDRALAAYSTLIDGLVDGAPGARLNLPEQLR